MHRLVKWRAAKEREETACWRWYTKFCTAACIQKAGRGRDDRVSASHTGAPTTDRETSRRRRSVGMWIRVGRFWEEESRWNRLEKIFFAARTWCMEELSEEHPPTLTAMANLASTYWNQGRWKEAEELQVKVMEARARVLGEKHPDTLAAVANLAATYRKQGRWKESEELEVKVMEARVRVLGEEHPNTLASMDSLAVIYSSQDRQDEADCLSASVNGLELRSKDGIPLQPGDL
ncbi:hypothetical protein LTR17_021202 [Elasticomyces elasticus]|nr:hypothetical protein LTR17_021202 [Elasticomyces elasticus]